jgi:hypothetical protein
MMETRLIRILVDNSEKNEVYTFQSKKVLKLRRERSLFIENTKT